MLTCSICINNEKTSKIKIITGKLICKECLVYLSHKPDKNKIQAELKELIKSIDKAIVAFSEGKDSTVDLYLAKEFCSKA